jgi:transcriptional regulator with XRE-family HTH domain
MTGKQLNQKEILKRIFSVYHVSTQQELGDKLGVSQDLISNWNTGKAAPTISVLEKIVIEKNVSWQWLLAEDAEHQVPPSAPNAARIREPINFVLNAKGIPVVGEAAADETQGRKAGFLPADAEARYDELRFPETTAAVKIIGDSMAPLLLGGQYAFIGPEYMGNFDNPRNYEIVVVDVEIRDEERAEADARWTGTYCKRIIDGGDVWVFLSIAPTGVPFTVAKSNCRLWPVLGVWFAGMGEPPEA